jgi:hypothetical protein
MAALINATKGLPIEKLCLRCKWPSDWMAMLPAILDATPNITTLEMEGEIGSKWSGDLKPLDRTLKFLTEFQDLTSLALPNAGDLGLSFDGGPRCGNAYFGRGGRANGRRVTEERAKTVEEAANMAIEALPHLKHFSVGGSCANITRNTEREVALVWPWTGRMKEYTYEKWPEQKDYSDDENEDFGLIA